MFDGVNAKTFSFVFVQQSFTANVTFSQVYIYYVKIFKTEWRAADVILNMLGVLLINIQSMSEIFFLIIPVKKQPSDCPNSVYRRITDRNILGIKKVKLKNLLGASDCSKIGKLAGEVR